MKQYLLEVGENSGFVRTVKKYALRQLTLKSEVAFRMYRASSYTITPRLNIVSI